ncbi:hypothetical protein [Bacillus sp. YKCMOAS1]|uniref:hypothetical protein n=1 Tax=Bacillus sp. YKCMOAS1 TaxID=2925778 RepID=UPI00253F236F|nr:hypothetical protein [Bacillus sp. YKCMOAS1]GLJ00973.1 hypothetical protein OAS1_02210 [Bacillus sp. YKCMOAS1]
MSKKNRNCLFCGNSNLTREHIFAQWLLDELNIRKIKMGMQHTTFYGSTISRRPLTPNTLINGLICQECNNGWLSQIENKVKPILTAILKYPNSNLSTFLKEQHELLSIWSLKTAMILNHASNFHKIVPKRHFKYIYKHRKIPENITVLMGFAENTAELDWVQSQVVMHIGDENIIKNPRLKDIYKITIQIDYLLLKIIYSPFYDFEYYHNDNTHLMLYPNLQAFHTFEMAEDLHSFDIQGSIYSKR